MTDGQRLWVELDRYFRYYHTTRPHEALYYLTPAGVYFDQTRKEALCMGTPSPNPWDLSLAAGIDGGRRSKDPAPLDPGTEVALGFHPWIALSSVQPTLTVYSSSVPLPGGP